MKNPIKSLIEKRRRYREKKKIPGYLGRVSDEIADDLYDFLSGFIEERDIYGCGPFWIIGDSFGDILKGNFKLESVQFDCDANGKLTDNAVAKSQMTHKKAWKTINAPYGNADWRYYPRGRVSVHQGKAYIHLNSRCNIPKIVDAVIDEFCIESLETVVDLNDTYQGNHYGFALK